MIIIPINGKITIEQALKKYKMKFSKHKVADELRDRQFFKKKSVTKREELKKAIFVNRKRKEDLD